MESDVYRSGTVLPGWNERLSWSAAAGGDSSLCGRFVRIVWMRKVFGHHRVLRAGLPVLGLHRPAFEVLRGKVSIRRVEEYTTTCSYVENESQDRDPAAFGRTARLNLGTAITEADRRAKRHPPTSGIDPVSRAVNLLESCTNPDSALIAFFDSFCCLSSSQSWCKRAKRLHVVRSP